MGLAIRYARWAFVGLAALRYTSLCGWIQKVVGPPQPRPKLGSIAPEARFEEAGPRLREFSRPPELPKRKHWTERSTYAPPVHGEIAVQSQNLPGPQRRRQVDQTGIGQIHFLVPIFSQN